MDVDPGAEAAGKRPVTRRTLLTGGALTAGGIALGGAAAFGLTRADGAVTTGSDVAAAGSDTRIGTSSEPFHGPHQAGIATEPQAHGVFVALDLVDRRSGPEPVRRMLRLLSDDAARLTQGRAALADAEPELADLPARLTVTFGFGPGLFAVTGTEARRPTGFAPLPAYPIDRLEDRWSGGDLLIQVCADDQVTVSHAVRTLVKDARAFAEVRWVQRGFRRSAGAQPTGTTQRNLMGQLDGTANPVPGSADFDRAVWISGDRPGPASSAAAPDWLIGGTTLVVRRIHMALDTWAALDEVAKEFTMGRRLADGAPLTGVAEHDAPDLSARDSLGFPVISEAAHVRLARVTAAEQKIHRRVYNYDEGLSASGQPDAGLIFASYQADIAGQYLPIQQRLAGGDLLNQWTTPIGSAVFVVPPGTGGEGWVGETLLG